MSRHERQRVSVIVPVRNGRADLARLVQALEAQTLPRSEFELVLGDDGSTDGSTDELDGRGGWISVAPGPPLNAYAARNRAVARSNGVTLAFCDADCIPEPEWLERGLALCGERDVIAGRIRFDVPEERTVWTLLDMDGYKDHERQVRNGTAETANLFVSRELFDEVGGFAEDYDAFADFEFVQKCSAAGASLSFASDVVVHHPTRNAARAFLRTQWVYSRSYAVHEARAGRRPQELSAKALVPVVSVARSRRWWGKSYGPDVRWLGENGVVPSRGETLKALPLMYLVVPYLRIAAQFAGWREGRRTTDAQCPPRS